MIGNDATPKRIPVIGETSARILVIGDVNIDVLIFPTPRADGTKELAFGWNYDDQYLSFRRGGGAWLLSDIITYAKKDTDKYLVHTYDDVFLQCFKDEYTPPCLKSLSIFSQYKQELQDEQPSVYRIERGGVFYESSESKMPARSATAVSLLVFFLQKQYGVLETPDNPLLEAFHNYLDSKDENPNEAHIDIAKRYMDTKYKPDHLDKQRINTETVRIDAGIVTDIFKSFKRKANMLPTYDNTIQKPRLIVIHDQHGGFRDLDPAITIEPFLKKNPYFRDPQLPPKPEDPGVIIWKMSTPLAQGRLWKHICNTYSARTIVVTSTESLRHEGVQIRDADSFEQSSYRLLSHLRHAGKFADLAKCAHLIVGFGFSVSLYEQKKATQHPFAS